ncbi:MAG: tandem-95 repeat protein, partial [Rhodospirillales bacterium]|nr:tandem-95 repeat protein [Rhodospirillales bacterium]
TPDDSFDDLAVGETRDVEITYTIEDGDGDTDTGTLTVTVTGSNDGPVATTDTVTVDEDSSVVIDVLANDIDIDGDTLSVTGIETQPQHGTVSLDPATGEVTYTPDDDYNGPDSFTYQITDEHGETSTATVNLTIDSENDNPVAVDDTAIVDEDGSVNINVLGNDSDVDGSSLSVTGATLAAGVGGVVAINENGTIDFTPDSSFDNLAVGESTQVEITYTVDDGQGGTDTATVTVTVTGSNDGPVATDDTASVVEDGSVVIDVLGNDTDVDGDVLSVSGIETQPEHGTVSIGEDGQITYTPDADYNGSDSFSYEITDENGETSTTTVNLTVDPTSDNPVAVDDTATVSEDSSVVIDVLGNDSDADGTVSVSGIDTQPAHGTVSIGEDGQITYTPDADYSGSDSFIYEIADEDGNTTTATVNLTVDPASDNPVAVDDTATVGEDSSVVIDVLGNDSDADGTVSVSGIDTQPAHGTVSIGEDGQITYTPDADYNGTDSFTYEIADEDGNTTTATVNLTVDPENDNPVAVDDSLDGTEDTAITFTADDLLANDTDADAGDSLAITNISDPEHGTITENPDGSYTFTPDENWSGETSFTYTVEDGSGETSTATASVSVEPSADAPTLSVELSDGVVSGGGEDAGTVLASEDFSGGVSGWGDSITEGGEGGEGGKHGGEGGEGGQMEIEQDETASKTFDFGQEHAGQTVVISFDSDTFGSWDDHGSKEDFFIVSANGEEMINTSDKGSNSHSIEVVLDENGQVQLDMTADATGHNEGVNIDNFQIVAGDDFGDSSSVTYDLDISANTTDDSESISGIVINGLPDDAVLSEPATYDEVNGTWSVEPNEDGSMPDTSGMTITTPEGSGEFAVEVTATSTETNGDTASVTTVVGIDTDAADDTTTVMDDGVNVLDTSSSENGQFVVGSDGSDDISTGSGSDLVFGGDGDDSIDAGGGNDLMIGGSGNDTFEGGEGDDAAFGGAGDDLFIFGAGDGSDFFSGGDGWSDTVQLDATAGDFGAPGGWDVQVDGDMAVTQTENTLEFESEASGTITLSDGSELTFEGVDKIEW